MSSTNKKKAPRDSYLTPIKVVEAVVSKLKTRYKAFEPYSCLEPGCAWGAHLNAACSAFPSIVRSVGVDIEEHSLSERHEFVHADFLSWKTDDKFDLILTNPPFGVAEECFLKAQSLLSLRGVGLMFERVGFLSSKRRRVEYKWRGRWVPGLWTRVNLREVWICTRRPAMVGQSTTDSCDYAYFLFDASFVGGQTQLDWLDW